MLCVPTVRLVVLQVAVFEFALPVGSATALQPLSVVPSAVKATLPVGALPFTVAVNVTLALTPDGLPEVPSSVVEATPPPMLTVRLSALGVALFTVTLMP